MTRPLRYVLPLLLFFIVRSAAYSQTATNPQTPPPNVATLHTGAKLVVVDVTVRDKDGKPIHGLTRDDFKLSESGKPQTLNSFEEYARPATSAAVPAMPHLPPGMFTNFTPVAAKGPLDIVLLDGLNSAIVDQGYFRQQLLDYLSKVPPGTRIAIFGMADHLYLLQGFTSDTSVLRAALATKKSNPHAAIAENSGANQSAQMDALTDPGVSPAVNGGESVLMTSAINSFISNIAVVGTELRVQESIEDITQLASWLLNFPGRKNVIWVSSSFPLGVLPGAPQADATDIIGEDSPIFVRMVNLLTEAQVSFYPLDPRGVQMDPEFTADDSAPNQITSATQRSSTFYGAKASEHSTMQAFASDTGGEALYNRNNLTKAVGEAFESGANYYTISYSPGEKKTGGEWRSIHVALADPAVHKGAQLSYRRGYYADNLKVPTRRTGTAEVSADPNAPAVESSRNSRGAMLHGAPTRQDIPFTTRVLPASRTTEDVVASGNGLDPNDPIKPPYRRYDIDCAASARYFSLATRSDGHRVGSVQTAVFVYDGDGHLLNTVSRTLHLDFTPQQYAEFQRLGFREHLEVSAPAKRESFFRIGIEERTSGRIGTVEVASSAVSNLPPPEYAGAQTTGDAGKASSQR